MGLHQIHAITDGVGSEERQERYKAYRSLYLRDKWFSISRGSICWLPRSDSCLPSELSQEIACNPYYSTRLSLAIIQEDIYKLLYSADSPRLSVENYKSEVSRIEESLDNWAKSQEIFSSSSSCSRDIVDLQLEFLGTRINAFRGSSDPMHLQRVLNDARASCMLLLISYGKHDDSMIEQLELLPLSKSPSKSLGRAATRASKRKGLNKHPQSNNGKGNLVTVAPLRFHSLLDSFSVPAFFLLVTSALWPLSTRDEPQARQDLILLQQVCDCYNDLDARNPVNNYTRKVGCTFKNLLAVVNIIREFQEPQPSSSNPRQQSSDPNASTNTQSIINQKTPSFPDFSDLPGPPVYLTPSIAQDTLSLSKNISARTTEAISAGESPVMLTPLDADYLGQWYDAPRQTTPSPNFQQSHPSIPGRKRPRLDDAETNLDDPDATSLSDFFPTTNMIPF